MNTMDPIAPPIETGGDARETRDAAEIDSDRRIREAKSHLSQRLAELEQRLGSLKENIDPRAWVPNPWARAGIAFGVGFLLGRTRIMRPLFGAALSAAASAVVKDFVHRRMAATDAE